jgi:hypothetical protein
VFAMQTSGMSVYTTREAILPRKNQEKPAEKPTAPVQPTLF